MSPAEPANGVRIKEECKEGKKANEGIAKRRKEIKQRDETGITRIIKDEIGSTWTYIGREKKRIGGRAWKKETRKRAREKRRGSKGICE